MGGVAQVSLRPLVNVFIPENPILRSFGNLPPKSGSRINLYAGCWPTDGAGVESADFPPFVLTLVVKAAKTFVLI